MNAAGTADMSDVRPRFGEPVRGLDVLVVGSGVAGLSAAVRLAKAGGLEVGVLTKGDLEQSTTRWAQGGIAAVLAGDEDSTDLHLADTLRAGAGLCDEQAVRVLVEEGARSVYELISLGAVFDRVPDGALSRAREGGHSTARVLHAGGIATGAEVERALVSAVRESAAAILEQWFALDLVVESGRCAGVLALDPLGVVRRVEASHVVLSSGGAGQLFAVTTNPREATGDGVAMALRAGLPVADLEFVQFHPTALHHPAMPRPLLSEALRGHGAVLRDGKGERFVEELAPRDVVSRAIARTLAAEGSDHVYLDATGLEEFARRFPTIQVALDEVGLDPRVDWLPVAPAAHYLSGGVLVDLDGATALPGLWAAGEVACTGVHGANRLASNSLLEGMVFGARCVDAILSGRDRPERSGAFAGLKTTAPDHEARAGGEPLVSPVPHGLDLALPVSACPLCMCGGEGPSRYSSVADGASTTVGPSTALRGEVWVPPESNAPMRDRLQAAMTRFVGVERDAASLGEAAAVIRDLRAAGLGSTTGSPGDPPHVDRSGAELRNLLEVGRGVVEAATAREESRGAHSRSDFPDTSPRWRVRLGHNCGAPSSA